MNNPIVVNGVEYVEKPAKMLCLGCAAVDDWDLCQAMPSCVPQIREDGKQVIFLKKEN